MSADGLLPFDPKHGLGPSRCLRDNAALKRALGPAAYQQLQEVCDTIEDTTLQAAERLQLAGMKLLKIDAETGSPAWRNAFAATVQDTDWKALLQLPLNPQHCPQVLAEAARYYHPPLHALRQKDLREIFRTLPAAQETTYGQWLTTVPLPGQVAHCLPRPGDRTTR